MTPNKASRTGNACVGSRLFAMAVLSMAALAVAACTPPITLIERVIEARSTGDIIEDNRIVLEVNGAMAEIGSIKASTEIYEQRLLIIGLFENRSGHDELRKRVRAIEGVKKLYWHAIHMSEAEQKRREDQMLGWADTLVLDGKIEVQLLATEGVGSVNIRVAVDAMGVVYLLGRAKSPGELKKVLAVARGAEGAKRVVDYVEVRP